ncbi:MAG: deoxyribose-phosphate aldolase [Desulfarculaceae bacterium]|jgi:deoxyribose-phosphate aldolase
MTKGMVLLRVLENRFQADVWCGALEEADIPFLLRTYEDTAYDGLFVSQKGYASLFVEEDWLQHAREIDEGLATQIPNLEMSPHSLARRMDHTLLDPAAGPDQLKRHLDQCLEMGCAAACVLPWMLDTAARTLAGSPVSACTVVSFPLGSDSAQTKEASARELAQAGADELDVVLNRGLALGGEVERAVDEMAQVARAAAPSRVKVILECSALGPQLSRSLAEALAPTRVYMVKTGTGFQGPAIPAEVIMLKEAVGGALGIKAAGGIRSLEQAAALIRAGADRLGSSNGWDIWKQAKKQWPPKG